MIFQKVEPALIDADSYRQKNLWTQPHTCAIAKALIALGMDEDTLVVIDIDGMIWPLKKGQKNGFFLGSVAAWADYE